MLQGPHGHGLFSWHTRRGQGDEMRRKLLRPGLSTSGALLLVLICSAGPAQAEQATGNLRITTPVAGSLQLHHAEAWDTTVALQPGTTTLWDLPTGQYVVAFEPAGSGGRGSAASRATGAADIWNGLTAHLEILPGERQIRTAGAPDDGRGLTTLLPPELWAVLPGSKEQILDGLDTHIRWRPAARVAGMPLRVAAERREILPGQAAGMGPAWISITPGGTDGPCDRNLTLAQPAQEMPDQGAADLSRDPLMKVALGALQSSRSATDISAHLRLRPVTLLGRSVRGLGALRYSNLRDADPRSTAERTLPANDAVVLDLTGRLEFGPPTVGVLQSRKAGASGLVPTLIALDVPWNLTLSVASRGWQRNHFLEEYRRIPDHAPHEETALFTCRADFALRLGDYRRAHCWVGYDRYLTWVGDGLYGQDLDRYGRFPIDGNGTTDETGSYWAASGDGDTTVEHAFDYFGRKFATSLSAGFGIRQTVGEDLLAGLRGALTVHTHRRYEHFSPIDTWTLLDEMSYGNTLRIGYDETGRRTTDEPFGAGKLRTARVSLWSKGTLGTRTRIEAAVGGHGFLCRDSALVSQEDPRGGDGIFTPADLREVDAQIDPEVYLGVRGNLGSRLTAWGVGYRSVHLPPLEAFSSPQAYLDMSIPADGRYEGVMGNPDLAAEKETGFELGMTTPLTVGARRWQLSAAVHGARLDDAIGMEYIDLGDDPESDADRFPVYANNGTLRRYGLHAEATTGDLAGPWWLRLSYDFGRIESDHFEPPLLDGRWLYPGRPQGEYESEGYASPLGGILDVIDGASESGPGSSAFRPANLDQPHRFSLALVKPGKPPGPTVDWLKLILKGWTRALLVRIESGRPYTQTYIHPAALLPPADIGTRGFEDLAWEAPVAELERGAGRMPLRFTVDLAITRRVMAGPRWIEFSLEALNLLGWQNSRAVYRATGEPDNDGCRDSRGCSAELPEGSDTDSYADRLVDPRHYDRPFVLRAGVTVEIL
jgi:hypothetical protein